MFLQGCVVLPNLTFSSALESLFGHFEDSGPPFGALGVHFGDPGLPKKLQSEPFETSCVFLAVFVELWVSLGDSFGVIFATFSSFVVPTWEVRLWVLFWKHLGEKIAPVQGLYVVKTQ